MAILLSRRSRRAPANMPKSLRTQTQVLSTRQPGELVLERPACQGCGQLASIHCDLAIHQEILDARCKNRRIFIRSAVDKGFRIKDQDIRKIALLQQASVLELQSLGGRGSAGAGGCSERAHVFLEA